MKLVVSLSQNTYPTLVVNFYLVIQPADCDCTLLNWVMPQPQSLITTVKKEVSDTLTILRPTVDPNSRNTTPMIRSCYRTKAPAGNGCDETTAISKVIEKGATLPSFITRATNVLTVNSQSNNDVKVYTMEVTIQTQFELQPIVFDTVSIDLRVCVITNLDAPPAPTGNDIIQNIFATSAKTIDLSNQGFTQRPACGY